MDVFRHWRRAAALLLLLPLALAACGTNSSSGSSSKSGSLPLLTLDYFSGASGQLASTLDPAQVTSSTAGDTIALTNANLVHILPNNTVAPDLATWKVSSNRLVYTFTIRKNARFSNGHAVTAKDAAFSIQRSLALSTGSPVANTYLGLIKGALAYSAGKAKSVSGLKVVSTGTLQITITKPAAYFLMALSYPTADVLDPSVVRGHAADPNNNYLTSTCAANQGAGPFEFVCQNKSSAATSFYRAGSTPAYSFKPNPYYYGAKPHIKIKLPAIGTVDTSYKDFQTHVLDSTIVPTAYLKQWTNKPQLVQYPTSIVTYLTPNFKSAPFSNLHCRLAMAYAINRNLIANDILHGATKPDYVVVPDGYLGWYDGSKSEPHYDVSRAKSEFSQCPYKSTAVKLVYPTGSSDTNNEFVAIANMMKQVGFNVTLKGTTANDWYNIVSHPLTSTNTQLVRNGWQQDYPDPQDYCTVLLRSNSAYNIGGWKSARYDQLVDKADVTANRTQRAKLYQQAQHIALSQGAWIALTNAVGHELVASNVHGLVGTSAYGDLVPKNYDWSQVSVSS
jgi:oligopeptide transport system substrate-binding protein